MWIIKQAAVNGPICAAQPLYSQCSLPFADAAFGTYNRASAWGDSFGE